jgi:Concanavalin A-like lectin/glucanases superfamily
MCKLTLILCGAVFSVPLAAAEPDFVTTVAATKPLAFYRLTAASGNSEVGSTTYRAQGGVGDAAPGVFGGNSRAVKLNGRDAYIVSTQSGGIAGAASIMAWVNLESLPSNSGHHFYVAGESQNGNDLDVQFETDNALRFFTASNGSITYKPAAGDLVHRWHMIVATLDTVTQARALYWDGKAVANDKGGGKPNKTGVFSIGESTVFRGRYLNGSVEEVALWNRAVNASEVAAIYATATGSGGAAVPSTATAGSQGSTLFPNTAKVQLEGPNGVMPLKPEEKIAFLFASAVQGIESDCQFQLQRACGMAEVLGGVKSANGQRTGHLKYDPRTDPNYTYSVGALDMAWDVHATPKKPGLMGFYIWSRGLAVATIVYNASGAASAIDRQFTSSSVEGDSFQIQ